MKWQIEVNKISYDSLAPNLAFTYDFILSFVMIMCYNRNFINLCVNAYVGIDYCARGGLDSCHANATCINLKITHKCTCVTGYAGTGFQCDGNY